MFWYVTIFSLVAGSGVDSASNRHE